MIDAGPGVRSHLVLRDIRKSFGASAAVDGVSFAVGEGEFVVLLGPSGCGKTTTLRIIAGLETADSGELFIRGDAATDKPPYQRDVGVVFQNYALFPHMTVFDNVAYGLRMRGVPGGKIAPRVAETLALVQLAGLEGRYPRQLSGGQQQRVAVARAIVIRPSVLLFDEPLSNLDARLRRTMRVEMRQLQRTLGIPAIFVTHDQEEALSIADRIVVMNRGRIEQIGTPLDVYLRPSSAFVAEFIGECNFIEGELGEAAAGTSRFTAPGGLSFHVARPASGAVGTKGTVGIRPESIAVAPAGAPPAGANVVQGRVTSSAYLGAFRHIRVAVDGGRELLLYQQASVVGPAAAHSPDDGEDVQLYWWPAACAFYPDPDGRSR